MKESSHRPAAVAALLALIGAPAPVLAQWSADVSIAQGLRVAPRPFGEAADTGLWLAGGWDALPMARLQLGLGVAVDGRRGRVDLESRLMLRVAPAGFPLYGRATLLVTDLLAGAPRLGLGPGAGVRGRFDGVELFAEMAALPRSGRGADRRARLVWVVEGRLGAGVDF